MSQNTIPYTVRGMVPISTDTNGNAFTVFVPAYGKYWGAKGTWDALNLDWNIAGNWSNAASHAFITSNAAEIRLVSAGIIIRNIAAMTSCQGTLHTGILTYCVPNQDSPLLNLNNSEDFLSPMTSGMEQSIIFKPLGSDAHAFIKESTVTNTFSDFNWTSAFIEVSGGPISTPVLTVEYVYNLEIQLTQAGVSTTGLASAVTGSRPANPVALASQAQIHTSIPSIIMGGVEAVEKRISSAAYTSLTNFVDTAATYGLGILGL